MPKTCVTNHQRDIIFTANKSISYRDLLTIAYHLDIVTCTEYNNLRFDYADLRKKVRTRELGDLLC